MKKKNENSREIILESALHLFASRGYDAVGINEITEKAGITKPTLYYFFGSKEGLFDVLLKEYYGKLNSHLEPVCSYEPNPNNYENDVYASLLKIAEVYFSFAEKYPEFYLMAISLFFAPPTSQPAAMSMPYHKIQYGMVEKVFYSFSSVHKNLKGQEKSMAMRFLSMINAQIAFWHREYASLCDEDVKSLVKQFMHGIYAM